MTNCLFCRIAERSASAHIVYETDEVVAFRDVNPQAPIHVLIIPRKHISTVNDLELDDAELVGKLSLAAAAVAEREGVADSGYRMLMNCNADAGQSVFHIHLHLLAGRPMGWPPWPTI